ncbi:MAG: transglycosylase domain-containing protein, partial [Terracidiphilus sp.]
MALKIKVRRPRWRHPYVFMALLAAAGVVVACVLAGFTVFGYYYVKYGDVVSARFQEPVFVDTAKIYAAPREVRPGQDLPISLIAGELRKAGYTPDGVNPASQLGTFSEGGDSITVQPGPQSYHAPDDATIHDTKGVVDSITDPQGRPLASYELEPLLVTGLSESA